MDTSAKPACSLPSLPPVRERCCDCGGGGLTSLGETCPSRNGLGHSHHY